MRLFSKYDFSKDYFMVKKILVLIMFVLTLPIYAVISEANFVGTYDLYDIYNDEGGNERIEKMAYAEFNKDGTCILSSSRTKTKGKFKFTATEEKISGMIVYELKLYDNTDGDEDQIIRLVSLEKNIIPGLKNYWNKNSFINSDYMISKGMSDGIAFIKR